MFVSCYCFFFNLGLFVSSRYLTYEFAVGEGVEEVMFSVYFVEGLTKIMLTMEVVNNNSNNYNIYYY